MLQCLLLPSALNITFSNKQRSPLPNSIHSHETDYRSSWVSGSSGEIFCMFPVGFPHFLNETLLSKAHRTRKFITSVSAKTTWIKSTKLWSVSSEDEGTMKLFNFPSHQIWQFCICGSAVRIIFARTLSFDKLNSDAKKLWCWGTSTLGWRGECWALDTSSGWWGERRVKRFVFCAGRIAARLLPSSQLHTYRWHIVHKTNRIDH